MLRNDPMKCLTGPVRLSYCHLLQPRAAEEGGEQKYGVTILIPKSDLATKADIDNAIQAAMTDAVSKKWGNVMPPNPAIPIHDGDGVRQSGLPYNEECKGHWVITASSNEKPDVVDTALKPITNAREIYSGMYARVTIRFYGFARSGNKGIACGLGHVMKISDGEPLVSRSNAEDDFAGIAQQTGAAAPQYGNPSGGGINPITGKPF